MCNSINKEGEANDKEPDRLAGIKPESYTSGKWFKFLNFAGTCYVYCHNFRL